MLDRTRHGLLIATIVLALGGCEEDRGPAERAGARLDEAMQDFRRDAEEAREDLEAAMAEAQKKLDEAMAQAREELDDDR